MNEGPLGIHEIKLVVEPSPGFSNGSGVAEHAHRTRDLGQVSARNNSGWLVVDADLEASGTPIHKLDGPLGLDGCNGSIDILEHKRVNQFDRGRMNFCFTLGTTSPR